MGTVDWTTLTSGITWTTVIAAMMAVAVGIISVDSVTAGIKRIRGIIKSS